MKLVRTLSMAFAAAVISSAAYASTMSYTEGNRADIVGSTRVTIDGTGIGDTAGTPPGFDLTSGGALDSGDKVNLFGRIITIADYYNFSSNLAFTIKWIFDGYTTVAGAVPAGESGFVSTPLANAGDGSATFTLIDANTNLVVASKVFTTNVVSGDPINLFGSSFGPGQYLFNVTGIGPKDAYYDIQIAAVPLPAGALLLITALGGLGVARRRAA